MITPSEIMKLLNAKELMLVAENIAGMQITGFGKPIRDTQLKILRTSELRILGGSLKII
jgi:hypothetical protein